MRKSSKTRLGAAPRGIRAAAITAAAVAAIAVILGGCARGASRQTDLGLVKSETSKSPVLTPQASESFGFSAQGAPGQEGQTPPAYKDLTTLAGAAPASSQLALPSERMVIKTAYLTIRVTDVDAAFTRAVQLAETSGGYVQASTQSVTGGKRADLTLRIPPGGFLPLIKALEGLGTEEEKSIQGQDVTEEYYDLQAELSNKEDVQHRLLQLLDRAAKVSDAVEVEQQLERVGSDVNRIKGRMKYLDAMVGLSTVNLTLYSQEKPIPGEFINWSLIGNGFVVAARALVRIFFFILQALVVVIPLGAICGGIAWLVIRRLRSRNKPTVKKAK